MSARNRPGNVSRPGSSRPTASDTNSASFTQVFYRGVYSFGIFFAGPALKKRLFSRLCGLSTRIPFQRLKKGKNGIWIFCGKCNFSGRFPFIPSGRFEAAIPAPPAMLGTRTCPFGPPWAQAAQFGCAGYAKTSDKRKSEKSS